MFQAGLVQAEVAGAADAGDVGGLPHGAFNAGADVVPVFPVLAQLAGAGGRDGLVDLAGRRNSWRPVRDVVHWALAGQARQVAVANLTTIACLFSCWTTWLQPVLVAPWGQVTCWWSQSMVNVPAVYPPERACGGLADSSGPSRVMPRARASSEQVGGGVPGVHCVLAGG